MEEFRSRLLSLTSKGNPGTFASPLGGIYLLKEKPFIGEIKNNEFKLTRNSLLLPTPYLIKGTFWQQNESNLKIDYNVSPLWFGYLWIRIFPVIAIIALNLILLNASIEEPLEVLLPLNLFFLLFFLPIGLTKIFKKSMEKKFLESLEIVEE